MENRGEQERRKTASTLRLDDYDPYRQTGFFNMPTIRKTDYVPESLLGFKYVMADKGKSKDAGVHFFLNDCQFERIWRTPERYLSLLSRYKCVLTPDFSLYMDMPLALMVYNVYRSRLIGQMLQDEGITVIPTLQYAGPETYRFCFDGLELGGVVATSTVGIASDSSGRATWAAGMDKAIELLKPSCVVCYGPDIGYEWHDTMVKHIKIDNRRWGQAHTRWIQGKEPKSGGTCRTVEDPWNGVDDHDWDVPYTWPNIRIE